jgi:uncharacterized protein with GYD domain
MLQTNLEGQMPKYLVEARYVGTGIEGLLREGGSRRRIAIDDLFRSVGGLVEAFYYTLGDKDVIIIGTLPDNATGAALAYKVNASGAVNCRTIVLMTPEEIDTAVAKSSRYRPPGAELEEAEAAKWDSEGGHPAPGVA